MLTKVQTILHLSTGDHMMKRFVEYDQALPLKVDISQNRWLEMGQPQSLVVTVERAPESW